MKASTIAVAAGFAFILTAGTPASAGCDINHWAAQAEPKVADEATESATEEQATDAAEAERPDSDDDAVSG